MSRKQIGHSESPMINRRNFQKVIGTSLLGATLTNPVSALTKPKKLKPKSNPLLHVGGDYHVVMSDDSLSYAMRQKAWTNPRNFQYHERHGVRHLTNSMEGAWNLDEMKQWKDDCDRAGMTWEAIRMDSGYIYAIPGADQARKLQEVIENVKKASAVGVKVITMHWTLIPIRRNGHTPGRGGSSYHSFKLEPNWQDLPVEKYGKINYDQYWERIRYFLTNIIPVCAQYDVRMAVHPYDPPGLPRGYQGVDNWDAAPATVFDSLKKYEAIVDSPYNGFQLCLGTIMEGLRDPKTELPPIVKYFAEKGKIYQIHMRNVRGGLHDFQEVYIDEGEVDFIDVIRILRDSGYAWSICPDHVPTHPDDPRGYQAFAQAFGYIRGMIDSANKEIIQ
ncbi:MAG: mannonate dehydratase [Saprospiraceae bacterium]|nr:mannonate dehydratase [Saprospiraceae bacterium]